MGKDADLFSEPAQSIEQQAGDRMQSAVSSSLSAPHHRLEVFHVLGKKSASAEEETPSSLAMCQKQNGLAMNSENFAEIDVIEIKRFS